MGELDITAIASAVIQLCGLASLAYYQGRKILRAIQADSADMDARVAAAVKLGMSAVDDRLETVERTMEAITDALAVIAEDYPRAKDALSSIERRTG